MSDWNDMLLAHRGVMDAIRLEAHRENVIHAATRWVKSESVYEADVLTDDLHASVELLEVEMTGGPSEPVDWDKLT